MISHVFIGVNDFNRALVFYQGVMEILGLDLKFTDFERPWAGWKHPRHCTASFRGGQTVRQPICDAREWANDCSAST